MAKTEPALASGIATGTRSATEISALFAAVTLGSVARLSYVLASDFPLNDGGLFYAMVRDLQRAGYALPVTASYNGEDIPFAYPPLGFYLAAAVADLARVDLIQIFRFLPFCLSTLTIVAFWLLARTMLRHPVAVAVASLAFALHPRSFQWEIMGGGLTRSLGLLFAILATRQIVLMYQDRARRHVAPVAVLAALTLLGHVEMGWTLAITAAVFFVAEGRNRAGLAHSAAVAAGTLFGISPWLAVTVSRYGLSPFLAATDDGTTPFYGLTWLLTLHVSFEPLFPLIGGLAFLGIVVCLAHRRLVLPCWLVALFLLDPRNAPVAAATPLALLAGVSVRDLLLPWLTANSIARVDQRPSATEAAGVRPTSVAARVALGFVMLYGLFSAMYGQRLAVVGLSAGERDAMQWAGRDTSPTSRFAVVTGDSWPSDRTSEWFPVLSGRRSVATVQGTEWLPDHAFARRIASHDEIEACASLDADCVARWAADGNARFDYVYVAKRRSLDGTLGPLAPPECCRALRASLDADPRFARVYDGADASIYRSTQFGYP